MPETVIANDPASPKLHGGESEAISNPDRAFSTGQSGDCHGPFLFADTFSRF